MKKRLLFLVSLVLLCVGFATAEEFQFSVIGEWYGGMIPTYQQQYGECLDGTFIFEGYEVEYKINDYAGTISLVIGDGEEQEQGECWYQPLGERRHFVYSWQEDMWSENNILTGYLLEPAENQSYACYSMECGTRFLFAKDTGIVNKTERFDYLIHDDTLYLMLGDNYSVGAIVPCGDDAFIYKTTETITYHPLLPPVELWMFFIRSSLVHK